MLTLLNNLRAFLRTPQTRKVLMRSSVCHKQARFIPLGSFFFLVCLALPAVAVPLSSHAALPGEPCPLDQVGRTQLASDRKNVIACLETDTPDASVWKATTQSGGGITGGCFQDEGSGRYIEHWGRGCVGWIPQIDPVTGAWLNLINGYIEPGYECGPSGTEGSVEHGSTSGRVRILICIKTPT